jgi:hypothetical protein
VEARPAWWSMCTANRWMPRFQTTRERRPGGPFHSYAPDANSLIRVPDGRRERLFLVTHYEYHTEAPLAAGQGSMELYAQLPGVMSLAELRQDRARGTLAARRLTNIDMNGIGGLWIPCAGSLTPWNTHLGGEEYEPNARQFEHEPLEAMNLYLGTPGRKAAEGGANPYRYGHVVEVKVSPQGTASVAKRYAMGRLATELAEVMPDERTAYLGDDGRDTMLFMFVADRPRDLSAGTLYAAKWEQRSGEHGGSADLKWIRLGHADEDGIRALVDRGIRFSDIFESATTEAVRAEPERHKDFKPVFVYEGQGGKRAPGSGAKQEVAWLKVKPAWRPPPHFSNRAATAPCSAPPANSPRWRASPTTPPTASSMSPCPTSRAACSRARTARARRTTSASRARPRISPAAPSTKPICPAHKGRRRRTDRQRLGRRHNAGATARRQKAVRPDRLRRPRPLRHGPRRQSGQHQVFGRNCAHCSSARIPATT